MNKSRSKSKRVGKPVLGLIIFLVAILLGIYLETRPRLAPGQAPLTDIQNVGTLRAQFNRDVGKTRLILLVSPTCGPCLAATHWVQTQLLDQLPSDQLRVYAVWLPTLVGDAREKWDGTTMPESRVTHFWDGELHVGEWFAEQVEGYRGVSWDTYYLYGPDARWETSSSHLVGWGGTIYDKRETLKMQIITLLEGVP